MDRPPALSNEGADYGLHQVNRRTFCPSAQAVTDSTSWRDNQMEFTESISTSPALQLAVCETQRKVRRTRSAPELSHPDPQPDLNSLLNEDEQSAVGALEDAITTAKRHSLAMASRQKPDLGDPRCSSLSGRVQGHQVKSIEKSRLGRVTALKCEESGIRHKKQANTHARNSRRDGHTHVPYHQRKSTEETHRPSPVLSVESVVENHTVDEPAAHSVAGSNAAVQAPQIDASTLKRGLEPERLMRLAGSSLLKRGLDSGTTSTIVTGVVSAIIGAGGTAAGIATWRLASKSRQRNKLERDIELQEIGDRLTDESDARRQLGLELKSLIEQVKRQHKDIEQRHAELDRRSRLIDQRAGRLEPEAFQRMQQAMLERDQAQNYRTRHLERWAAELQEWEVSVEARRQSVETRADQLKRRDLRIHYRRFVMAEMIAAQRERCIKNQEKLWQTAFDERKGAIAAQELEIEERRARFNGECRVLAEVEKLWNTRIEEFKTTSEAYKRNERTWREELQKSRDKIAAQQLEFETLRSRVSDQYKSVVDESRTARQQPQLEVQGSSGPQAPLKFEQPSVIDRISSQTGKAEELMQRWANLKRQK